MSSFNLNLPKAVISELLSGRGTLEELYGLDRQSLAGKPKYCSSFSWLMEAVPSELRLIKNKISKMNDEQKAVLWVNLAYEAIKEKNGFRIRKAQRQLSRDIAVSIIRKVPIVAEAPTGTGKSLAYLIGSLAAYRLDTDSTKPPIVIATATKALQGQLAKDDAPLLVKAGIVDLSKVVVVKGKSNYLCLQEADNAMSYHRNPTSPNIAFDENLQKVDIFELGEYLKAYYRKEWLGDFDLWKGKNRVITTGLVATESGCAVKDCAFYKECAFYNARDKLTQAEIIISNHHLTLIDMNLSTGGIDGNGNGFGVYPFNNYHVVFDEAHHLPETALMIGQSDAKIHQIYGLQDLMKNTFKFIENSEYLTELVRVSNISSRALLSSMLFLKVKSLDKLLTAYEVDPDSKEFRFKKGIVPETIIKVIDGIHSSASPILSVSAELMKEARLKETETAPPAFKKKHPEGSDEEAKHNNFKSLRKLGADINNKLGSFLRCLEFFATSKTLAKWIHYEETSDELTIHCSPLEGSEVLNPILWNGSRARGIVMVSATLQDFDGFSRFEEKCGVPAFATKKELPHIFNFGESQLIVAGMVHTPKREEHEAYRLELSIKLPKVIEKGKATLILFPSWMMVNHFKPLLRREFGDAVLIQGERSLDALLDTHKTRVSKGLTSILIGTVSLSEGLDLPEDLCTHVIITAIPFSVPNTAIERENAERLGNKYFYKRSLPEALVRLIQMTGRLNRRETDKGKITIFDKRLGSTRYGRALLEALPPFQKIIESV